MKTKLILFIKRKMIEKEEIQHIAQLARLKLKKEELESLGKDLETILEYVDQLKKLDVSGVELKEEAEAESLREDKVETALSSAKDLQSLAPSRKDTYISVKSVFQNKA